MATSRRAGAAGSSRAVRRSPCPSWPPVAAARRLSRYMSSSAARRSASGRRAVGALPGAADAHADRHHRGAERDRRRDDGTQPVGQQCAVGVRRQQHGELVTAEPGHQVRRARARGASGRRPRAAPRRPPRGRGVSLTCLKRSRSSSSTANGLPAAVTASASRACSCARLARPVSGSCSAAVRVPRLGLLPQRAVQAGVARATDSAPAYVGQQLLLAAAEVARRRRTARRRRAPTAAAGCPAAPRRRSPCARPAGRRRRRCARW